MARSGIQYNDVQQAIDHLLARGDSPSVQRIREVLGTGSFTTISEHFRHWRNERAQNRDVPPPKGIPESIVSLATEMWQQAQDVAAFLMWTAEPKMMARKQAGLTGVIFLTILSVLLYMTNKRLWAPHKKAAKKA